MKITFAGTPQFGALVLGALAASRHEIVLVLTQPDRPAGRGRELRMSPVKQLALARGLHVEQPERISTAEFVRHMQSLGVEALTVAAFGQILKPVLLDAMPCINMHGSLLPRYRGAAPVERAIMDGEKETGVSIMKIVPALDSGDVYLRRAVTIREDDDAGSVYEKLAGAGGEALVEVLDSLEAGTLEGEPQDESQVTYAEKIAPGDRAIDWSRPARDIFNQVRALSPHIGAYTNAAGQRLKVWKVALAASREAPAVPGGGGAVTECAAESGEEPAVEAGKMPAAESGEEASAAPGSVTIEGERLFVRTGTGLVEILLLQPEGKRRITAAEFLRGYRQLLDGGRLG